MDVPTLAQVDVVPAAQVVVVMAVQEGVKEHVVQDVLEVVPVPAPQLALPVVDPAVRTHAQTPVVALALMIAEGGVEELAILLALILAKILALVVRDVQLHV